MVVEVCNIIVVFQNNVLYMTVNCAKFEKKNNLNSTPFSGELP